MMNRVMLLACLGLLAACGDFGANAETKGKFGRGNQPEVERQDPLVEVIPVVRDNISTFERSNGRIETRDLADVYAQVSEVCLEVMHDVGDSVEAGAVLARLNRERYGIQLQGAELARQEAQVTHRRNELEADKRRADVERIERYFDPKEPEASRVFTKDAWEAAVLERDKALNSVQSSALALRKADGELASAILQLRHTEILAPIRGVITERNLRTNELVSQGAIVFKMADISVLEVRLDVAEAGLAGLRNPQRVKAISLLGLEEKADLATAHAVLLEVTAFPQARFIAWLDRISPVIDAARGMASVMVRVVLPADLDEATHGPLLRQLDPESRRAVLATAGLAAGGANLELRPGMWADARIATRLIENATLVPAAALVGDTEVVWKIEPDKDNPQTGTARRIEVAARRGVSTEGRFQLLPPPRGRPDSTQVVPGDLVAVRGQATLRDGQKVRIRDLSQ